MTARHRGQYHGAGFFTGLGLRFRHFAQRYLLPFTAVLGLTLLPVRGMFLGIASPGYLTNEAAIAIAAATNALQNPNTTKHPRVVRL
jgi:hypothetical protein